MQDNPHKPVNRYITVKDDGTLDLMKASIDRGDKVHWQPESDDTEFTITFTAATPVDFRKKPNKKGEKLVGKVNDCVNRDDSFPYVVNGGKRAGPELIVDGGRQRRRRRKGARRAKAAKRAKR